MFQKPRQIGDTAFDVIGTVVGILDPEAFSGGGDQLHQTGRTGGVMLEKNSHSFDLFNWLADSEPVKVVGSGGNNVNKDSPLIDNCVVTVEYANHVRATLVMCLFAEHGSRPTLDIVGDKGRLIVDREAQRLVHYSRTDAEPREWTFKDRREGLLHIGLPEEHAAFIRCIRTGEAVLVDGPSARRTIQVSLAAERAVAGESAVAIETFRETFRGHTTHIPPYPLPFLRTAPGRD